MQEAQEVLNQSSLNRAASNRAVDEYSRSGRSMSSLFDADTPASGPSSFSDYADAPLTELLDTVGAPSPASIFTSPITSDVPSNVIPPLPYLALSHRLMQIALRLRSHA